MGKSKGTSVTGMGPMNKGKKTPVGGANPGTSKPNGVTKGFPDGGKPAGTNQANVPMRTN